MAALGAAYKLLRDHGMRAAVARHFIVELRKSGFVLVKEAELVKSKKIEQKIDVIIKLMKLNRRQR
jgi:hypothetical protein